MDKEAINLKESDKRYMGMFRGRNRKKINVIISLSHTKICGQEINYPQFYMLKDKKL